MNGIVMISKYMFHTLKLYKYIIIIIRSSRNACILHLRYAKQVCHYINNQNVLKICIITSKNEVNLHCRDMYDLNIDREM